MENFRRSSRRHNQRNEVAKSVNTNWLNEEYFFGPSSPATKEAQAEVSLLRQLSLCFARLLLFAVRPRSWCGAMVQCSDCVTRTVRQTGFDLKIIHITRAL